MQLSLKGDNVRAFVNDWDYTLSGLKHVPSEDILESMFRKQTEGSHQMKETLALHNLGITQRGETASYQNLLHNLFKTLGLGPPVYQSIISTVCKIGILVPFAICVMQPIFPVEIN